MADNQNQPTTPIPAPQAAPTVDQDQFESKYAPTVDLNAFDQKYGSDTPSSNPYSGPFADHFFSADSTGRLMTAFGQGAQQGWGSLGMKSDVDSIFKGIAKNTPLLNTFLASHAEGAKDINENLIRPWAHIADTVLESPYRAVTAGMGAIGGLISGGAQELQTEGKDLSTSKSLLTQGVGSALQGGSEVLGAFLPSDFDPSDPTNTANAFFGAELPGHAHTEPFVDQATTARAYGAIGEGEAGYFNTKPISEEHASERIQAAQDAGLSTVPKIDRPTFDINQLAREIDPDTFKEYDRLQDLQENLRASKDYLTAQAEGPDGKIAYKAKGDLEDVKQRLVDLDQKILQLVPDAAEARSKVSQFLESPEEHGDMYRDYVQSKLIETQMKLDGLEPDVTIARDHASSLLPSQEVIEEESKKQEQNLKNKLKQEVYDRDLNNPKNADKIPDKSQPQQTSGGFSTEGTQETPGTTIGPSSETSGGSSRLTSIEGTGEEKVRGLSKSIEAEAKETGLADKLDTPTYKALVKADQYGAADQIIHDDPERAKRIAFGEEEPPGGLHPEAVVRQLKKDAIAKGDVNTLQRLASSSRSAEATTMGQRIGLLADDRDITDPVEAIKSVQESRTKVASRDVQKEVKNIETYIDQAASNESAWIKFLQDVVSC